MGILVAVAEQVLDVLDGRPARFAVNMPLVDPETMAIIGPYIDAAEVAASIASQLTPGAISRARIEYAGNIANYETSPLRAAVVVGMLKRATEENVTIVNAERFAEQFGIRIDEESGPAREPYANLLVVHLFGPDGDTQVAATSTRRGVLVTAIGEYQGIDIVPTAAPYALAVENRDRPGMIGRVGTLLGGWDVNIVYMSVAAGTEHRALMVLGTNRPLTAEELDEVTAIEDIFDARQIDLS